LLTVKDYPVYSTGILIGKHKKGLTLGRFWNEYLLYEWRNTEHGRMIWRTSGSKNRYHSEFCNRRENFPLYTIYMQEIMNGMGPESFGNQIDLFEKFLNEKEYDHTVFMMKIRTFLHMAGKTDPWMSKECAHVSALSYKKGRCTGSIPNQKIRFSTGLLPGHIHLLFCFYSYQKYLRFCSSLYPLRFYWNFGWIHLHFL